VGGASRGGPASRLNRAAATPACKLALKFGLLTVDDTGMGARETELQPSAVAQPMYGQPARTVTPGLEHPWRQLVAAGFTAVVIMSAGIAALNALVHRLT
jgi:hypothetical protein